MQYSAEVLVLQLLEADVQLAEAAHARRREALERARDSAETTPAGAAARIGRRARRVRRASAAARLAAR